MPDLRTATGSRRATQGQYTKPGVYFPTPGSYTDFIIVENKTVDSKEATISYLTPHPTETAALLVKQEFSGFEDGKKSRTRTYRTLPGTATSKYQWDDSLLTFVEIVTQDVAIGTAGPDATAEPRLLEINDQPTEMGWITRTIVRIPTTLDLATISRTEYKSDQFTFPAILDSLTATPTSTGFGNIQTGEDTTEWRSTDRYESYTVKADIRPSLSLPTIHKIDTSFHISTGVLSVDSIYAIAPNNIRADGQILNFNLGSVLNDAITGTSLSATASVYDSRFAGLTETFTFGASVPTATTYKAAVTADEWQIIASDVVHYRGRIWIKINTSIKLK